MKTSQFTRENLKTIREDIDTALATVAEKHGIDLKIGNISFSSDRFSAKIEAACLSGAGSVEEVNFKSYAPLFGLNPADFGKTIRINGDEVTLVGIYPKSTKYPIVGQKADGRKFKYTAESVSLVLERMAKAA